MIELKQNDPSAQGAIGQYAALMYYTALGYNCYIQPSDYGEIDIVIYKNGIHENIQVKTTTSKSGNAHNVGLDSVGINAAKAITIKKIQDTKFDKLFVLTGYWDIFEFTKDEVGTRSNITLETEENRINYKGRIYQNNNDSYETIVKNKYLFRHKERKVGKLKDISKEELEKKLIEYKYNYYALAKEYGVSDNGLIKKVKRFGIFKKSLEYRKENNLKL